MSEETTNETEEVNENTTEAEKEVFSELDFDDTTWRSEEAGDETPVATDDTETSNSTEEPSPLTAEQINALSSMGFDESDLSALKDSPILEKIVSAATKQPNTDDVSTTSGDGVPGSPDESGNDGSFQIDLDGDVYDPDLVKQLKSMHEHYDRKITELNAVIQSQGNEAYGAKVDRMFEGSGMDKFFGKGQTSDLSENSQEYANRTKVQEELLSLTRGYEATGRQTPDFPELFQKAVRAAIGEEMSSEARREFTEKVEARHKNRISRPTNRASKSKGSVQQAVRNVSRLMRDKGMLDDSSESFE